MSERLNIIHLRTKLTQKRKVLGGGFNWWRFGVVGCGAMRLVIVVTGLRCRRHQSSGPLVVCGGSRGGIGVWVVIHVWWNGRYGGEVDRLR